ncbi:MAG: helix-turn-helix transcriptional regulator [Alphaproteobacteria bacterium]
MTNRKPSKKAPSWLQTLQQLLNERDFSPRQLSILAGLNPTAVRDMLIGRARNPRYDTLQALARVLGTTPAYLMGDATAQHDLNQGKFPDKLDLLTEIIARIQETADDMGRKLSSKELATMATTLYRQMLADEQKPAALASQARTLIAYAQNNDGAARKIKK